MPCLPFREVWLADFEFSAPDGERPVVRCMVAREYRTGRTVRLWLDGEEAPARPPFDVGPDTLFVAYFASAEMGCFLALGWPMPANILDLYVEFKWLTCGRGGEPAKPKLVYALDWFGLPSMGAEEKEAMRELAVRGGEYTPAERQALLDYCEEDVKALASLLPRLLPRIDLPRAVLRGAFMRAVAHMEHNGVPIDVPTLALLDEHWETLQLEMVRAFDANYGVYEGVHFRAERFAHWLARHGISWPRTATGQLEMDDDVFKDMAEVHSVLRPLRQLRQAMSMLRLADLPVGRDGRNRCLMSPFGTITARCAPSTSQFALARPAWMRSLIRPEEGRALVYLDWSAQEYGIGACLSGDCEMIADYLGGDPYLGFARRIGMVPADATKETHEAERNIIKVVMLAIQYGMGERGLAARINRPVCYARGLLQAHRLAYGKFWRWSEAAVNLGLFRGRVWTRFGWQTWARWKRPEPDDPGRPNVRSLSNFPCQANGSDMLRLAAGRACDAGLMLDATVHDALLIEAGAGQVEDAAREARAAMDRASELVLGGLRLRVDAKVIRWPDRYRDRRGADFFADLMARLEACRGRHAARPWKQYALW